MTLRTGVTGMDYISVMPNLSLHITEVVTRTAARRSSLEKDLRNT